MDRGIESTQARVYHRVSKTELEVDGESKKERERGEVDENREI